MSDEQRTREEAIFQRLKQQSEGRLPKMAAVMASKEPDEVFGETEFQLRDLSRELAKDALQAGAEEAKKRDVQS